MTSPLFGYDPAGHSSGAIHPLRAAAERHVQALRDMDLVGPADAVVVELVLHLAAAVSGVTKAYALANLSKELREALEALPKPSEGDEWAKFVSLLEGARVPPAPVELAADER